ncbi:centromere protein I-like [Actinia tenebrosa]|uniref:Centromere protein I-like n=1 Tax=Actinia tenebrosa TaxID=6105 RepID=A0A6P8IJE8_ACTTE|nr:centromere protein I-like [Actinia tenebrosa]
MSEVVSDNDRVTEAIKFLIEQEEPTKRIKNNSKTFLAVETLESHSGKNGLIEAQIIQLIDVACSGKYADGVASKVVKSLIPRESVPVLAIVKTVSWISTNTLSSSLQALLLRWIIVIYKLIDDISQLHSLYGIIFLFLESDILCPHACLLLSNLTRQENVKRFRIKKLLNLQTRVGSQPHLNDLLSIYKMFCPNLVSMATSSKSVWFKEKDRSWREAIYKVQVQKGCLNIVHCGIAWAKRNSQLAIEKIFLQARETKDKELRRKRLGGIIIPPPSKVSRLTNMTSRKEEEDDEKVALLQLHDFSDLLENIDKIELPSQIASVLESPFLQHVVCCNPDDVTLQRLNFWLNQSLYQEFLQGEDCKPDSSNTRLLKTLIQFTSFLQESIPAVEVWLVQYLFSWNGEDLRTLILKLIPYFRLLPFSKLNDLVLEPLRKLFFSSSVFVKCQIMYCFTNLLRNFAAVELPRYQDLQRATPNSSRTNMTSISIFAEEELTSFDPFETIYDFIRFVDRLCVMGLQKEQDHPLLQHCVLDFFELASVLHTEFQVPFVVVPSAGFVYRLFFADNAMACSRLCQIIVNYRDTFVSLREFDKYREQLSSVPASGESIKILNQYILDISDSLWRNKAFVDREKSFCFGIPWSHSDNLELRHTNEAFSLHHHQALVGFAWTFLKETQPEDVALNPSLIKDRVRKAYLKFLQQLGILGVVRFLETFIRQKS